MDSQPTGGRFDGMYGVLAAFEALEALEDAGVKTKRPVVAVAWTNEEGSRFQPGAMGSAVFAGHNDLEKMLQVKDWKGVMLKDALAETLKAAPAPMREGPPGFPLDGYVETHIEQGPRLENEGRTIGVVTAIQGSRRYIVTTEGEEAHAGTTRALPARMPSRLRSASPGPCTKPRPTRTTRCASPSAGSKSHRGRPTRYRAARLHHRHAPIPTIPC